MGFKRNKATGGVFNTGITFKCNACGKKFPDDQTGFCPECGSDDIIEA